MRFAALLLVLLVLAARADAQPGVQRAERLATGFERVGYRLPFDDTTQARLDVTLRLGDLAVRRVIVYPAEDDTTGSPRRHFILTRAGRTVAELPGDYDGAWEEGFDVLRGDLDGDGTRELLIVQHEGSGNGLGVATWSVWILPETGGARPLRFATQDYGPTGLVVRRPEGLRLMAASWESGAEPRRGEGLYYTARFFRYDAGRLVPDGQILQRRYLFSFQNLRGREDGQRRYHPDRWIQHNTRVAARDPWLPQTARIASETVTLLAPVPGEGMRVRLADGRVEVRPTDTLGDAATGRFFPWNYVPLGQDATWLQGRTARLDTYTSPYSDSGQAYVLWLMP